MKFVILQQKVSVQVSYYYNNKNNNQQLLLLPYCYWYYWYCYCCYNNLCLESSETDSLKMSVVYLYFCAKDVLWSSFFLHQYTASSITGSLWSSPGKHFLESCRAVLSRLSEWPECEHINGLLMLIIVMGVRKITRLHMESNAHAAI